MRKLTGVILLFCLALWGCGSAQPTEPAPALPAESESAEASQSQAPQRQSAADKSLQRLHF